MYSSRRKETPFAFVSTPLTCSNGWTRGMPPPSRELFYCTKCVVLVHNSQCFQEHNNILWRLRRPKPRFVSHKEHRYLSGKPGAMNIASVTVGSGSGLLDGTRNNFPNLQSDDTTVGDYVSALEESNVSVRQPPDREFDEREEHLRHMEEEVTPNRVDRNVLLKTAGTTTKSVHGGERKRGGKKARAILDAIATPIVQSSTFTFRSSFDCISYNQGKYDSFEYGRYGNPTTRAAEEKVMMLEEAEDALISSSGMNSVTTMLMALLSPNNRLITTRDCYRRTRQFLQTILPQMNIQTVVVDPADTGAVESALKEGAALFFSEMPTNPLIRVIDAENIVKLCKKFGTICCIDSTFATAYNLKPLKLDADLVLHSGTKYLGGHNDLMCGVIAGRKELLERIRSLHGILGGVVDPHSSYLLLRGMKTLPLRMRAHNENASALAEALSKHPKISKVHYPSLTSHIDYDVARKHFEHGFGGVLSFELAGDPFGVETFVAGIRFVDALRIPYIGPSLGGVESLVEQVCIMGYFDQPLKTRRELGITNGLIRFSCGVEDTNDLLNDVLQALEFV